MTNEQFKQLESLLGELGEHMNHHLYCLIPCCIGDGVHIGLYDVNGQPFIKELSFSLEDCANKAKKSAEEFYDLTTVKPK